MIRPSTSSSSASLSISSISLDEQNNNQSFGTDILPDLPPEEQYQFAFDLLRSQKLNEAKKALDEFIEKNNQQTKP